MGGLLSDDRFSCLIQGRDDAKHRKKDLILANPCNGDRICVRKSGPCMLTLCSQGVVHLESQKFVWGPLPLIAPFERQKISGDRKKTKIFVVVSYHGSSFMFWVGKHEMAFEIALLHFLPPTSAATPWSMYVIFSTLTTIRSNISVKHAYYGDTLLQKNSDQKTVSMGKFFYFSLFPKHRPCTSCVFSYGLIALWCETKGFCFNFSSPPPSPTILILR